MKLDNSIDLSFKGQAILELKEYDEHGILQVVQTTVEKNIVLKDMYYNIMTVDPGGFQNTTSFRICISSESANPLFTKTNFASSVFATGDPTPFLAAQQYSRNIGEIGNPNNTPSVTYLQRFIAPTVTRTINSLGISSSASTLITNSTNSSISNLRTYIKLVTPIVQTNLQVLDITYKVSIDWGSTVVNANNFYSLYCLTQSFLGVATASVNIPYARQIIFNKIENGYLSNTEALGYSSIEGNDVGSIQLNHTYHLITGSNLNNSIDLIVGIYQNPVNNHFKTVGQNSNVHQINPNYVGRFVHAYLTGATKPISGFPISLGHKTKQVMTKTSNLSSITSHSLNSTKVTYDANELANSSWQPSISDLSSPNDFPSTYILKVTAAGGINTGRYKIYKTGWGGWNRGFWKDPIADKFLCFDLSRKEVTWTPAPAADNYDFYNYRWLYKWSSSIGIERFVSYRRDKGFALYELTDQNVNVIYTRTLTQINATITKIFDIAVNQTLNLVYVATDVGLFSVNVSNNAVVTLSPDKCLAVCVGISNSVFGAFNPSPGVGRISGSIGANWQTALPIGSPSPAINWNNIWRIFIDKESSVHHMMIIEGITPKGVMASLPNASAVVYRYRWWNSSSGVVGTYTYTKPTNSTGSVLVSDLYMFPTHNSILCSGGVWIYPSEIAPIRTYSVNVMGLFPKDIREDMFNSNIYINNAPDNIVNGNLMSSPVTTTIGNSAGTNVAGNAILCKSKIAVSLFNSSILSSIQTNAGGLGDFIKAKLGTDGTVFNLIFTMSDHYTTTGANTPELYNNDANKVPASVLNNPSSIIVANTTYPIPRRMTLFYAVNVDLTSTPAATILNYPEYGTTAEYCIDYIRAYQYGNLITTHDKRIIIADIQSNVHGAGFRMFATIRNPTTDLDTELCQTWSWNGSAWVEDPHNNGVGKPIHTSTDSLVDGLTINWTDLQPGNSKPLIAGQYYTLSRCTAPNQVPFDQHSPSPPITTSYSPRNKSATITDTITNINSSTIYYLSKSSLGSSPDPSFYNLGTNAVLLIKTATLNEIVVPINMTSGSPSAGSVSIDPNNSRIRTAAGDNGKTLVITYQYLLKLDASEV